jgi:trk system potassium uptake protein
VLRLVLLATMTVEIALTAILAIRFGAAYDKSWGEALWHGLFHAVSAFNNAGFSTYSDNLMGFVVDPLIVIPINGGDRAGRARPSRPLRATT